MRQLGERRAFIPALIAIATVVSAAGCGSSGSNPSTRATASPPSTTQTSTTNQPREHAFISKHYGFRVALSGDWSETDAQVDWNGQHLEGLGSPAFATFSDPATSRTLVAADAPVPHRTGLAEWQAAMVRGTPAVCSHASAAQKTTLDGGPALAWMTRCQDGYDVNKLAALHGGRGYIVFLASQTANNDAQDQRVFEAMRKSFRFGR